MANPYYIPRQRNDSFLNFAELATRLYGLKEQSRLSEAETAARNRQTDLAERIEFGSPATGTQPMDTGQGPFSVNQKLTMPGSPAVEGLMSMKQRELGINQEQLGINRQEAETKRMAVHAAIPYHDRQFDKNDYVNTVIWFQKLGIGNSKFLDMAKQAAADKEVTKGAMVLNMKTNPAYRETLMEDVQNAIIKGANDPAFAGSDQAKKLRSLLTIADNDQTWGMLIDKMSPMTAQSMAPKLAASDMVQVVDAQGKPVWAPASQAGGKPAYVKPENPGEWFKTVGRDLVDVRGGTPKLVHRAPGEQKMDEVTRQELIGIRSDKRSLQREIDSIRKLPDVDYYGPARDRLPDLEAELSDLNARETAITSPGRTSARTAGSGYRTAEDVRTAFKAGKLTKERAAKILKDTFGYE